MLDEGGHLLDLARTAAPAVQPVDLAAVKRQVNSEEFDDDDTLLQEKLDAAVGELDGYAGRLGGRCLVEQTWVLYLDRFQHPGLYGGHDRHRYRRAREIRLPLSPLIAVDSITYLDASSVRQTLDPATYTAVTGEQARVVLKASASWPSALCDVRSIAVTFKSGYAAKGSNAEPDPADVPAPLRQWIQLRAAELYANREGRVIVDSRATLIENPVMDDLLSLYMADFL